MNQRLTEIYNLIDKNSKGVCDIGTDHGYIPIRLAAEGYIGNIFATDIHSAPLLRAENNAKQHHVDGHIRFCMFDGLPEQLSDQFDTAVITGMGGDLICSILDRADWIFCENYSLILQPMTKAEVLRYYLVNNGFHIMEDILVSDRNRIYQIMKCSFTSVIESFTDLDFFVGKPENRDPVLYKKLILHQRSLFQKAADGAAAAGDTSKEFFYRSILNQIKKFRSEHKWS